MASPEGDGQSSYFEGKAARFLDELAERMWRSVPMFFALGAGFLLLTGFYRVGPSDLGVVRTLGQITGQALPGFHFRIPFVQDVELVEVATTHRLRLGGADSNSPTLRVSRDGKLCALDVSVDYRITDAEKYTSHLANAEQAVRALSDAALSRAARESPSDQLFGADHRGIERKLQEALHAQLAEAQSGIEITEVRLLSVEPPAEVKQAAEDMRRARDERQELVAAAMSERTTQLEGARNEATLALGAAQAYASERTLRAKADSERFETLVAEYRAAPDATKRRLRLETAQRVLSKVPKTLLDVPADALLDAALKDQAAGKPRSQDKAGPR